MTTDLAVIEAALERATPGPWEVSGFDSGHSRYETNWYVIHPDYGDAICDMEAYERALGNQFGKQNAEADANLIVLLRNTAAELVERVKAAEAEVEHQKRIREGEGYRAQMAWEDQHRSRLGAERAWARWRERAEAAEAAIARVRELCESVPKTIAFNPSDAAYLSGQVDFADTVLDALNHTDGITPESAASDEVTRFTSANIQGVDETTPRARVEDSTEPILRPTDQRYEPPAVDDEGGCCR